MFKKHYLALDHVIVAMAAFKQGKPVLAAASMEKALKCKDYAETIAALDDANEVKAKPTLAQALTIVAAKGSKKKKPPFGGKKAPPFKKKAKAGLEDGDDAGGEELMEDDLLGDEETAEGEGDMGEGEDLDLDALELDDTDEELGGEDDLDLESLDGNDDVLEMPEATSAGGLGTQEDPTSGGEAPDAEDHGEPPTDTTKTATPSPEAAKAKAKASMSRQDAVKASKRILANVHILEQQAAAAKTAVKAKAKK
jgi:hypothetical protein